MAILRANGSFLKANSPFVHERFSFESDNSLDYIKIRALGMGV